MQPLLKEGEHRTSGVAGIRTPSVERMSPNGGATVRSSLLRHGHTSTVACVQLITSGLRVNCGCRTGKTHREEIYR